MKKKSSLLLILGICLSMGLVNTACSDDDIGKIIEGDPIEGSWGYDGISHVVNTSFLPANDSIKKDLIKKNKTSGFKLQLNKDLTYVMVEHTILQDSGRYELSGENLVFTSKMHEQPYIDTGKLFLQNNDLTLTYDVTDTYTAEYMESLGISGAEWIHVDLVVYYYLFKRL